MRTLSCLQKRISCKALFRSAAALLSSLALYSCASSSGVAHYAVTDGVVVSVPEQKLAVMHKGEIVKTFPISTSKFGIGDGKGTNHTPLGKMTVAQKIGGEQPLGMVFKSRRPTGEILPPNARGRDPIVSRIIWLKGTEKWNRNAMARYIYIHGTTEEFRLGRPASYGCVRMRSRDVAELYDAIAPGTPVVIENCTLDRSLAYTQASQGRNEG